VTVTEIDHRDAPSADAVERHADGQSSSRRALWAAICVLTVIGLLGLHAFVESATGEDEGLLLFYPLHVLHGRLPYRDFMSAYGPGETYLLAGLYWLFSPSVIVERAVGLLTHLAIAGGVFAYYRDRGIRLATCLALLSGILLMPLHNVAFALLACVAFSLWSLVLVLQRPGPRSLLAAGVLCGLAISWRPDTAPLALVPLLPGLWTRRSQLPWAVAGLIAGLLPTLAQLVATPNAFVTSILDRAAHGAAESRLPVPPVFPNDRRLFFVLAAATVIVVLSVLVRDRYRLPSVSLALFSALLIPQALQRCDAVHLIFAGCVIIPAATEVVYRLLHRLPATRTSSAALAVLVGISPLLVVPAVFGPPTVRGLVGPTHAAPTVEHDGRVLPGHGQDEARELRSLLATVDQVTTPGDTVFVTYADLVRPLFADISLYYLMPELQVTAHNLEVTPGVTNQPRARLDRDIATADVLILHGSDPDRWKQQFPYSRPGWAKPAEIVRDQFCLVDAIGAYRVYTPCSPESS
jgi:hypothetical protein